MKEQIKKMKSELKELAQQIKTQKPQYRSTVSAYDKSQIELIGWNKKPYTGKDPKLADAAYKLLSSVEKARYEFRHKHIAYCLLRGRSLQQIENKGVRCQTEKHAWGCNCPNMNYIKELMEKKDETVCNSEGRPLEESTSGSSGTCTGGVVATEPTTEGLEQRDTSVPESPKPGFFDRVKAIFG